jgi:hypothetical protein
VTTPWIAGQRTTRAAARTTRAEAKLARTEQQIHKLADDVRRDLRGRAS